jgi:tetratricopeptide (TPR) repeat protein
MPPERQQRVLEILQTALDLADSEIEGFLRQECGSDEALYQELRRVLREKARTGILDRPLLVAPSAGDAPPPPVFRPEQVVADRFRILRFLGRGGMGEVYEAVDLELRIRVALKTLLPAIAADGRMISRFKREIQLSRKVSHPNVCRVFDLARHPAAGSPGETTFFLTMEFLAGETLAAKLRRDGPMSLADAEPLIEQAAGALDAAHRAGIVHRDFKPSNVMLVDDGGKLRAVVTDFGLARGPALPEEATVTLTGHLMGTPDYMAPELLRGGPASAASDVYAFGVVVYQMLTGRKPPRSGASAASDTAIKELPASWRRMILGCLEEDPAKRCRSAGDALAVLRQRKPGLVPAVSGGGLSRRRVVGIAGVSAALAAAAVWAGWDRLEDLLRPLPAKRFVALMAWPPDTNQANQPLLKGILEAIGSRLARYEASFKDLLTISAGDVANQPPPKSLADAAGTLGANLVLGVEIRARGSGYQLQLGVFDASTGRVLRRRDVTASNSEVSRLPGGAARAAAQMLGLPLLPARMKDEEELAQVTPKVYLLFSEAEELFSRPNDSGLDQAIEKYQAALDLNPHFAAGYARLSMAYAEKYQRWHDRAALSLAAKNAAAALHYNPDSAKAVLSQALVDLYSGNTAQATGEIATSLKLDPGNPRVLLYKARAFRDLNRPGEEEAVYREILKERPNFWPAYNELGWSLYRQGKYQDAAEAFAEGSAVAPRVAILLTNLGTMDLLLNRKSEAQDALRRSLDRAPNELAYLNLGSMAFERGDYRTALQYYLKARDLMPRKDETWRNIADCYSMLQDGKRATESYGKAAAILSDALRINPQQGAAWMTLAFYEAKLGRRTQALADLKTAEERGAADVESQFTKAQVLAVLGEKERALQLVLSCMDKGLAKVEVDLALDLGEIREDPRYRRHAARLSSQK